jgi:hypothetical protein
MEMFGTICSSARAYLLTALNWITNITEPLVHVQIARIGAIIVPNSHSRLTEVVSAKMVNHTIFNSID